MGWSKKGLSKLAMVRVYVLNGGEVTPADTISWKHSDRRNRVADKIEKYDNIVKLQHEEIFKDVKSWRWFERDNMISGKTTGTKVVLDALGKLRDVS
jgi:phosphoketolase